MMTTHYMVELMYQ